MGGIIRCVARGVHLRRSRELSPGRQRGHAAHGVERARLGMFRPSIDWLFRSAAAAFNERHISVVLSGRLNDGAAGSCTVARCGGGAYAQETDSCSFGDMPRAAIATGCISRVQPSVLDEPRRTRRARTKSKPDFVFVATFAVGAGALRLPARARCASVRCPGTSRESRSFVPSRSPH